VESGGAGRSSQRRRDRATVRSAPTPGQTGRSTSRRCPRAPVGPGIAGIGGPTRETRHSRRSDAVDDRDTPRRPGQIVPTGEKFSGGLWTTACCGSAALLASRRSHSLSIPRSTSPQRRPCATWTPYRSCWRTCHQRGPGAPDKMGQPMYTGCGRPCGRLTTGVSGFSGISGISSSDAATGSPARGAPEAPFAQSRPDTRGTTG